MAQWVESRSRCTAETKGIGLATRPRRSASVWVGSNSLKCGFRSTESIFIVSFCALLRAFLLIHAPYKVPIMSVRFLGKLGETFLPIPFTRG
jgi:hypothetical protein